ncbi:MAG TPA: NAD(P)-dependent oxidoreductase [Caldilineaceae bacterium]|nr:NAD(P)-dependent oxidoreductase [Caldilineaceae bacterium]
MKVLILGGAGMLGPYVVPVLQQEHDLLVTDITPLNIDFRGEFRHVDVANFEQVMAAAAGMDAIINLSVLRQDRQLAFDVNTLGCYNMMSAAVEYGIRRVINTGPHFTVAGPSYENFDFGLNPDMPPQPGTNLYALTKSLGQEICRVFSEAYDIYVQTYLFYNFRDPADLRPDRPVRPFAISWQNAATIFPLGLKIALEELPSRCEVFNVFTDMPHGQFSNEKAKRLLGFEPWHDIDALWRR